MRRRLWTVAVALLLAGAVWMGGTAGWRLHEAALRRGCLPFFADATQLALQPAEAGRVRFAALGDTGTGSAGARRVAGALQRVCTREGCDFVALLGDNFYPDGVRSAADPLFESAFESVYGELAVPVLPILGNHDVHSPALYQVFHTLQSRRWRMPNFEYAYEAGPARFFALNTNCQPFAFWRLEGQVAQAFAGWTFVLGHHSLYSEGPHGDAPWIGRWLWGDSQPHVDFYLSGHNHLLEHFQRPGERTDYVVSGSGGAAPYESERPGAPSAAQRRFQAEVPGFAWFDVTAAAVTLRFYDAAGAPLYEYRRSRPVR